MARKAMDAISRGRIASRINAVKFSDAENVSSKLNQLHRLREEISGADSVLLGEVITPLLELLSDVVSPVRKFVTEILGQIGFKHPQFLPEVIPALINVLEDNTPAVARQAIICGIDLFRHTLVKVAMQGFFSSTFDESLKSSWEYMLKFRDEIFSVAFEVGSDGRRLAALKFVESFVLLYTPDPNGSIEPPSDNVSEVEFNITWLRGGHPTLNVGDLSVEASKSLGRLLDQLRLPAAKSVSTLTVIVLIKSLSVIASKRPSFYGRVLPVLLGLDPLTSSAKGFHLSGLNHALKNAFECCLACTHSGAVPWRNRLLSALKEMKFGKSFEQVGSQMLEDNGTECIDDSSLSQSQYDKSSTAEPITEQNEVGRKRNGWPDVSEETGKRVKLTPHVIEGPIHDPNVNKVKDLSDESPSRLGAESGPVRQLVAMFGTLVAQSENPAVSLEILISSISADLLADVVIANIRNLPPKYHKSDVDEELHLNIGGRPTVAENDAHIKQLSLLLAENLLHSSSSLPKEVKVEAHYISDTSELELQKTREEKPHVILDDVIIAYDDTQLSNLEATVVTNESTSHDDVPSVMDIDYPTVRSEIINVPIGEEEIPGVSVSTQDDGLPEIAVGLSTGSMDTDDANAEIVTNLSRSPVDLSQSLSTERPEELSPCPTIIDASSSSVALISDRVNTQLILPKMYAAVICLTDEQKDQLQELAYLRIINAYKQVATAGGGQVRFSVLAHSGIEFPSELDPWKLLKMHILSDYVNHEGHEITLQVLYRLFVEAEEDRDFFSATTATSAYEAFLLHVSETLRDSFPAASDKSLSRLLNEVPHLPKLIFKMLEDLCSPGCSANDGKELPSGDRVSQGLRIIWSLISLRPPIREPGLKIALKSAVHHLEEVRMKAIRLVANKLYPLSVISDKIEDYAKEMLLSVANGSQTVSREANVPETLLLKDEKNLNGNQLMRANNNDITTDTHQLKASENMLSSSVADVQRCMSLYFALCTKKHTLFRLIFEVYNSMSDIAKQAVHLQLPLLVRTIGSSRDLLNIMLDLPSGSEDLLMQVLHTLTDGTVPSSELLSTIKRIYDTKLKDIDILIPILPFMPKNEVLHIFPHLVNAPLVKFQVALSRTLQGLNHSSPVLTPAEALIAIHGIDPERDGIPLKKVTDACNFCIDQREIFSQPVLAKVLNQLVEQIPLPMLFMRTVLQAIGAFPSLVEFIMEILSRLVNKQIWKFPKLWVGFMKCALMTKPKSFGVLLQLPPAQLEVALNRTPALKPPLVAHANQQHIKSSLPRSTLVVLGIATEAQTSSPAKPVQSSTVETTSSDKEAVTDKSKESSTAS